MKRWLIMMVPLFIAACGDENAITEVGNPSTISTSTGLTQAMSKGVTNVFPAAAEASASAKALEMVFRADAQVGSDFSCSYDEVNRQATCACSEGGSVMYTYNEVFSQSGTTFSLNQSFSTTYNDCVVSACDETFVLSGSMSGSMEGTYDTATSSGTMTAEHQTSQACSGMTAGDVSIGFNMTMALQGTQKDFNGSICIDGVTYTFDSFDDLYQVLDPQATCSLPE